MKSFMAILPLAGLALAQGECGARKTVTKTEVNRVTITVQPSPVASAEADDDWTITSTIKTTTTITEWPSSSPAATRAHTHKPHFSHHPYGNGTFNATSTRVPTHTPQAPTTLETFVFASSSPAAVASSSASSSQSAVTLYVSPSPVAAPSETAIPTSESAAAVASAAPSTSPAKSSSSSDVTGTATFYGGNVDGGACSFTGYTIPSGLFGTAFGGNWDASQCGACVAVKGPNGNSITAMVVDQCPECDVTHLDLFQNAFGELADISKGVIDISYSIVPCDITTPITLKNKEGTSAYFFSMQVENANVAVSKLEVSTDGGATWQATTRQSYNFFEKSDKSGFGSDTVDVKVTSVDGSSITVNDVSVSAGSTKAASGNFS